MAPSFFEMCRLCGDFDLPGPQKLIPLYGREEYETRLKKIKNVMIYCWELKVAENDGSPQHICPKCFAKFDAYFSMRAFCRKSQSHLKTLFGKISQDRAKKCLVSNEKDSANKVQVVSNNETKNSIVHIAWCQPVAKPTIINQSKSRLVLNENNTINIKEADTTDNTTVMIKWQLPKFTTISVVKKGNALIPAKDSTTKKDNTVQANANNSSVGIKGNGSSTETVNMDQDEECVTNEDNEYIDNNDIESLEEESSNCIGVQQSQNNETSFGGSENGSASKENCPKDFKTLEEKFKSLVCLRKEQRQLPTSTTQVRTYFPKVEFVAMPAKVNKTVSKGEDDKGDKNINDDNEDNFVECEINSCVQLNTNDQDGIEEEDTDYLQDKEILKNQQTLKQVIRQNHNDDEKQMSIVKQPVLQLESPLEVLMNDPSLQNQIDLDELLNSEFKEPVLQTEIDSEVLLESEISDPEFEEYDHNDSIEKSKKEEKETATTNVENNEASDDEQDQEFDIVIEQPKIMRTKRNEIEKEFTCKYCYYDLEIPSTSPVVLESKEALEDHIKHVHDPSAPYTCMVCQNSYETQSQCRNHLISVHKKTRTICEICGLEMNTPNLKAHIDRWHAKGDFECKICGKKFKNISIANFKYHHKWHNEKSQYRCKVCGKISITSAERNTHMLVHTKDYVIKCEKCDKGFRTQYDKKYHLFKTHDDPPPVKCLYCAARFVLYQDRLEHMITMHEHVAKVIDEKLNCAHCNKHFRRSSGLRTHMSRGCPVKTNKPKPRPKNKYNYKPPPRVKKYSCDQCSDRFMKESALLKHISMHSNEGRPFQCDTCKLHFKARSHLEIHKRLKHSDVRPFSCSYCGKRFAYNFLMREHKRFHEGYKKVNNIMILRKEKTK